MPAYTITNNRKGSYTVLRQSEKNITIPPGQSVDVEMTDAEAKNAEYPGVSIEKSGSKSATKDSGNAKPSGNGQNGGKADAKKDGEDE